MPKVDIDNEKHFTSVGACKERDSLRAFVKRNLNNKDFTAQKALNFIDKRVERYNSRKGGLQTKKVKK